MSASFPMSADYKTLPAHWNSSADAFELERRAVFSKVWILVTHKCRFTKYGDYIAFEVANFPFFLSMDKQGDIHGFHNVCRHRAYPVLRKQQGSMPVVSCGYHGWSYSTTTGALTKAPKFDTVQGFNKDANGLFPIHVHVLENGFVFVNFDASPEGPVPFDTHFAQLEQEWRQFDPNEYEFAYGYHKQESYNWKTLMDGFAECYHCALVHPGLAKSIDTDKYKVETFDHWAHHTAPDYAGPNAKRAEGERPSAGPPFFTHIFPTTGVIKADALFYIMRVTPIDATHTRTDWEFYGRKGIPLEDIRRYNEFYKQVQDEDIAFCKRVQQNLNNGIYSTGILHPQRENGVIHYQNKVKEYVAAHLKLEREAGSEIRPAVPLSQRASQWDDITCSGADKCGSQDSQMSW